MLRQLPLARVHGFRHGADQDHLIGVKRCLTSFGFEHRVALVNLRPAERASPGCARRDNAPVLFATVAAARIAPVDHQEVGLGPFEQRNATSGGKTPCVLRCPFKHHRSPSSGLLSCPEQYAQSIHHRVRGVSRAGSFGGPDNQQERHHHDAHPHHEFEVVDVADHGGLRGDLLVKRGQREG
jgi:hypothetical protein